MMFIFLVTGYQQSVMTVSSRKAHSSGVTRDVSIPWTCRRRDKVLQTSTVHFTTASLELVTFYLWRVYPIAYPKLGLNVIYICEKPINRRKNFDYFVDFKVRIEKIIGSHVFQQESSSILAFFVLDVRTYSYTIKHYASRKAVTPSSISMPSPFSTHCVYPTTHQLTPSFHPRI